MDDESALNSILKELIHAVQNELNQRNLSHLSITGIQFGTNDNLMAFDEKALVCRRVGTDARGKPIIQCS